MTRRSHRVGAFAEEALMQLSRFFSSAIARWLLMGGFVALAVIAYVAWGRDSGDDVPTLIMVSPHGGDIRREFESAFSAWHQKKYNSPVKIAWADVGGNGTGNIIRALSAEYATKKTSGYDIAWGGGSATFNDFNECGFLEKPQLAEEVLARVPANIFGTPLHGPRGQLDCGDDVEFWHRDQ